MNKLLVEIEKIKTKTKQLFGSWEDGELRLIKKQLAKLTTLEMLAKEVSRKY